jgi:Ca2+-binding RTX toxin-like protein
MRTRAVLLLVAMAVALVVVGGVAYALTTIPCDGERDQDAATGSCLGTEDSDKIIGTSGDDRILAMGSRDRVFGEGGNDTVDGFGGNDFIYGGPDNDGGSDPGALNLEGAENNDTVYGGDGNDLIDAANNDTTGSRDRSIGGAGDDEILAADGNKDTINCGDGFDEVTMDDILDTQRNCDVVTVVAQSP